jgi:hypothetical protein
VLEFSRRLSFLLGDLSIICRKLHYSDGCIRGIALANHSLAGAAVSQIKSIHVYDFDNTRTSY